MSHDHDHTEPPSDISLRVKALDPTEVANAFAASFAPMPAAAKKAKIPPTMTIQRYIKYT